MFLQNVKQVAERFDLTDRINRAISYDVRLDRVWQIPVEWNFRLKNSAGNANDKRIHLHPGLASASAEDFKDTFLHELAHSCEYILYGQGGHSQTWWEAMIRLGCKPWEGRYHSIASCKRSRSRTSPMK